MRPTVLHIGTFASSHPTQQDTYRPPGLQIHALHLATREHSKQPSRSSKAPITAQSKMILRRSDPQGMGSRRRGLHRPCHCRPAPSTHEPTRSIGPTSSSYHIAKELAWRHAFGSVALVPSTPLRLPDPQLTRTAACPAPSKKHTCGAGDTRLPATA